MLKKSAIIFGSSCETKMFGEILFEPMINWAIDTCYTAGIETVFTVIGTGDNLQQDKLDKRTNCFVQEDTIESTQSIAITQQLVVDGEDGNILILKGSMPFVDANSIERAYQMHDSQHNVVTAISTPINTYNTVGFWINGKYLLELLSKINDCKFGDEDCVTEIFNALTKDTVKIAHYISLNPALCATAKTSKELYELNQIATKSVIEKHMDLGVEFICLDGIIIGKDVQIGTGTKILAGTMLRGTTTIGKDCIIGPNSLVEDSRIGDCSKLNSTQCYQSQIESNVSIGPFCHIRPNSHILSGVHLGDFVEVKNSTIGEDTHVSHLTYVGDSDVGKRVNFGCGVVTVNYNGKTKARCTIGDDAFIGCNTNLVAPVTIGDNGYTAAGSTITQHVAEDSLGIARARQVNKEGYNKKLRG